MLAFIKSLIEFFSCKHHWNFICNVPGKERSIWDCDKCGKLGLRFYFVDAPYYYELTHMKKD